MTIEEQIAKAVVQQILGVIEDVASRSASKALEYAQVQVRQADAARIKGVSRKTISNHRAKGTIRSVHKNVLAADVERIGK